MNSLPLKRCGWYTAASLVAAANMNDRDPATNRAVRAVPPEVSVSEVKVIRDILVLLI
jgi:hypothetical protein